MGQCKLLLSVCNISSTSSTIMKTVCLLLIVLVAVASAQESTPSPAEIQDLCVQALTEKADILKSFMPSTAPAEADPEGVLAFINAGDYAGACTKMGSDLHAVVAYVLSVLPNDGLLHGK